LHSKTHFRRYRGSRVQFSCFALPNTFSAVLRARGPVFIFCALKLIFGGSDDFWSGFYVLRSRTHFRRFEGVRSRFHDLCSQSHFLWYRGCRVPFSSFLLPDSFSVVLCASGPVFMFYAIEPIFEGIVGVETHFLVFQPRLVLGGTEVTRSSFHLLLSRIRFRRYRGGLVQF
jgi:hypothetical protein